MSSNRPSTNHTNTRRKTEIGLEELRLLCDDNLLPLRLWLVLARPRMFAPPLLLDALRLEHRPLELRGLVHRLWQVSYPVTYQSAHRYICARGDVRVRVTHREILLTSASAFQRALRVSRYSIAARSRAVMIPSLSDACAFQIRTFPSSEPESTNRASPVYTVDITLCSRSSKSVRVRM